MKLFYRQLGEGQPFIILHGLFGQGDNWNSFAKQMEKEGFAVYLVDLRNHGQSPHSDIWNYKEMSADLLELINNNEQLKIGNINLLGHSMGGKVAMQFALEHPELLNKLIVVDIGPKYYSPHHQQIINGLNAIDLNQINTRKDAEQILSQHIDDVGTRQFLLKNLTRKEIASETTPVEKFSWRFNLKIISSQINEIGKAISENSKCITTTLFVRGSKSNYIVDQDLELIKEIFPNSNLQTINDAGHWLHAEKPKEFFEVIIKFIK